MEVHLGRKKLDEGRGSASPAGAGRPTSPRAQSEQSSASSTAAAGAAASSAGNQALAAILFELEVFSISIVLTHSI